MEKKIKKIKDQVQYCSAASVVAVFVSLSREGKNKRLIYLTDLLFSLLLYVYTVGEKWMQRDKGKGERI